MKPLLGGWVGNLQCKAQLQVKGHGDSFSCVLLRARVVFGRWQDLVNFRDIGDLLTHFNLAAGDWNVFPPSSCRQPRNARNVKLHTSPATSSKKR